MSFLKKVNVVRRNFMRGLTKNIGSSPKSIVIKPGTTLSVKRVLISRPNARLGNLLLITPLVQEVAKTFPNCKIDLFVRGFLGPVIFKNYTNVDYIIQLPKKPFKQLIKYMGVWIGIKKHRYDIVINVSKNSSSGRLSAKFSRGTYKFFGDDIPNIQSAYSDYAHIAKYPVYNFRAYMASLGIQINKDNAVPPIDLKLDAQELEHGKRLLLDIVKNTTKTISIFTYATGNKCYSTTWWVDFYDRLKAEYPDFNIVEILPVENVSQIAFKAPTFYSKEVREIGAVIANTVVFIGADSGIMHLASAVQTPTVGLFGITNTATYAPYGNGSRGFNTRETNEDDWIKAIDKIVRP